jgi:hypothetical protein
MLVMILLGGVVGVAGGYYALLWLRGPSIDFLNVARYLPQAILPSEFDTGPRQLATNAPPSAPVAADPAQGDEQDEPTQLTTEAPQETADDTPEMQASYTTTDEPTEEPAPAQDDRYAIDASEPAPPEVQPLEPDAATDTGLTPSPENATATTPGDDARVANAPPWPVPTSVSQRSADELRFTNALTFTADELSVALEEAKKVQPALMSGKLSDSKEAARAKGYSYSMLADLAQKSAFVDSAAPAHITGPLQEATAGLFRRTLSDAHTRGEVALILPKWLASRNRKHGGVFFAGRLSSRENKGSVIECQAELDSGESITLLWPDEAAGVFELYIERLGESAGPTGVVGCVVDQPAEQVSGYGGDAPQAIWVRNLITLE